MAKRDPPNMISKMMKRLTRPKDTPPPAYDSLISKQKPEDTPMESEFPITESRWAATRPAGFGSPAGESLRLSPHSHRANMVFTFTNKDRQLRSDEKAPTWTAIMEVWVDNIPALMRHGFHWSAANVDRSSQWIETFGLLEVATTFMEERRRYGKQRRRYTIRGSTTGPKWVAHINVFSRDASTIVDFSLDQINMDTISEAEAWSFARRKVYQAQMKDSGICFNTIYDKMPLEGWWPWPKAKPDGQAAG